MKKRIQLKVIDPRIGKQYPLPKYATSGSAGVDLRAFLDDVLELKPKQVELISSGGEQACGDDGEGRMLEPSELVQRMVQLSALNKSLSRYKVVVTAGPTHEMIDPVRYITNRSSGRMGFALAQAAAELGGDVHLVTGPVSLETPPQVKRYDVCSAEEMLQAVMQVVPDANIFVACAAVGDYRAQHVFEHKIKREEQEMLLKLNQTPDILATVGSMQPHPFLVGFAAETQKLQSNAKKKLLAKALDMIVANKVGVDYPYGFDSLNNEVIVYKRNKKVALGPDSKTALGRQIIKHIVDYYEHTRAYEKRIQLKVIDPRIGKQYPLPKYATSGSAGVDLRACLDDVLELKPKQVELISSGGEQACGDEGEGRMLEPSELVQRMVQLSALNKSLSRYKVVVTAGPTHEMIDPVRYITNRSSGRMGFALAQAAAELGADVHLVAGPVSLETPPQVKRYDVCSAEEMLQAVMQVVPDANIFVACAAVGDYRAQHVFEHKIKREEQEMLLKLNQTPDILATVGSMQPHPFLVGFAAETQKLQSNAKKKLLAKALDMIVANKVGVDYPYGFDSLNNEVIVYKRNKKVALGPDSKTALGRQIIKHIVDYYEHTRAYEKTHTA